MKFWIRYVVWYEITRQWERRWVWWAIALIPRQLKKWIVVQAAVRADWDGHPPSVTYVEMAKVFGD